MKWLEKDAKAINKNITEIGHLSLKSHKICVK